MNSLTAKNSRLYWRRQTEKLYYLFCFIAFKEQMLFATVEEKWLLYIALCSLTMQNGCLTNSFVLHEKNKDIVFLYNQGSQRNKCIYIWHCRLVEWQGCTICEYDLFWLLAWKTVEDYRRNPKFGDVIGYMIYFTS